ncbi:MAG TPA: histidine phosphatase family protein [Flavobacterium sp.]|nr:histidine phosphatase family protein [Flavobacterium sp.]
MKTLILIRHAKSDWNSPTGDYDRQLAESGKRDAKAISSKAYELLPDHYIVWSSPANRAQQTATIFTATVFYPFEDIIFKEELYTFDIKALEKAIKSCDNLHVCLIVFGHNEAITDFVNKFGDIFIDNVPTSGFVSITFDTNEWQSIQKGKTMKVIFPRDLKS